MSDDPEAEWEQVRALAAGDLTAYARDARPLAPRTGQGEVRQAVHKSTGITVAVKKALDPVSGADRDRMRTEIEAASTLQGNPHVMPVLDQSPGSDWFVMPLADHNAASLPTPWTTSQLRQLIEQVGAGLAAAHELGWVHRDVKPANLLWLNGRWVVADWGLGRRPRGETQQQHTRTGTLLGSTGWAAPELERNAHEATAAADIYSLGQVMGALLTGQHPSQNVPLLPPSGPWRQIVRAATQIDPDKRPRTIAELLALIDRELDEAPVPAGLVADKLLAQATANGDHVPDLDHRRRDAARALWYHAAGHTDDTDVLLLVLPQLPASAAADAARHSREDTVELVAALGAVLEDRPRIEYHEADRIILLLLGVATVAARDEDWDLLEASVGALLAWDARWDQWGPQAKIRSWLERLGGDAARIVGHALSNEPDAAAHFSELATDRRIDRRIAAAIAG